MTWHHTTTTPADLRHLLQEIRRRGGTVASCQHFSDDLLVTWFVL